MNKNLKRALNTTAAVSMSLAMVLGAVSPVNAKDGMTSVIAVDQDNAKEVFFDLSNAINKIGLEELNADSTATIAGTEDSNIFAVILKGKSVLEKYATGSEYKELQTWLDVVETIAADTATDENSKGMFSTEYFADTANDTQYTGGLVNYYAGKMNIQNNGTIDNPDNAAWGGTSFANESAAAEQQKAVKAYEKMSKWIEEGYYDRLDDELTDRFDVVYDRLEEVTADYIVADEDVLDLFVAAWTTVLEQDLAEKAGTELDFGKNKIEFDKETGLAGGTDVTIDLSNKSAIKGRIAAIKAAPNYYRVKNASEVEDIIAQYEELLGNITDLKDLLKDEAYVEFKKTKTADDKKSVASFISAYKYDGDSNTDAKKAAELAANLDDEQWAILKAVKEDVLDNAYNFETKKVGNIYVDKTETVSGFNAKSTVERDFGNSYKVLFSLVDNKEGKFGFDVVAEHMEAFETAYAAVTEDIETLTPKTIKATDKETLEAAEDAYWELVHVNGAYSKNVSKEQEKVLRKVDAKLENLREAFDNLGVTNVTGWVETEAGWEYYDENGLRVYEGWAAGNGYWSFMKKGYSVSNEWCAAKDGWYYMGADGKMVTGKVVIDGVEQDFGTDGIWVR